MTMGRIARRAAGWLLVASVAVAAGPVRSEETRAPRDPDVAPEDRLAVLVERIRLESSRRRTMEADFVQLKESALLKEPLEASGVFSYEAPDRARWEFVAPEAVSLVIRGDEMLTWYRDLGEAERFQVGKQSQKVLEYLGASTSIIALLEYFTVYLHMPEDVAEPYKLRLEPRFKRIEKRIKEARDLGRAGALPAGQAALRRSGRRRDRVPLRELPVQRGYRGGMVRADHPRRDRDRGPSSRAESLRRLTRRADRLRASGP